MTITILLLTGCLSGLLGFQDDSATQQTAATAAVVDGHQITRARVQRQLKTSLGKRDIPSDMRSRLEQEARDHLVNRHLVMQAVEASGVKVAPSKVTYEISKLTDRLAEIDQTLESHLKEIGSTRAEIEYEFRWQHLWAKYLDKHLSEKNLKKFYEKHRLRFDDTEVHLAHILFAPEAEATAEEIRQKIAEGKLSWNDAVKQHSLAKSSVENHGDVGWVNYHGPMTPEFCQAGINLNKDEISAAVTTSFGTHLIKCLEVRPGKTQFTDARNKVRTEAMRFLFKKLGNDQRPKSTIEILE